MVWKRDGIVGVDVMVKDELCEKVSRHIDRFHGVHEGYGVDQRNLGGRMLLVLPVELCVKYVVSERGKEDGIQTGRT